MSADTAASRRAVVLLSGGMDSAVTLAIAREQGFACHALGVDYGQRSISELNAALQVSDALGAVELKTVAVDLRALGGSALTADIDVPMDMVGHAATQFAADNTVPVTYVPARNTIMLSIALGWAEVLGAESIFCGINAVDYSGYPDCRPEFLEAFQQLARLAVCEQGAPIRIEAPLLQLSKAQIAQEAHRLGVDLGITVSCYQADDDGRACRHCEACRLRAEGFRAAGIDDPTRYR